MQKTCSRETQYYNTPITICDQGKKFDSLFLENISDIADVTAQVIHIIYIY